MSYATRGITENQQYWDQNVNHVHVMGLLAIQSRVNASNVWEIQKDGALNAAKLDTLAILTMGARPVSAQKKVHWIVFVML